MNYISTMLLTHFIIINKMKYKTKGDIIKCYVYVYVCTYGRL